MTMKEQAEYIAELLTGILKRIPREQGLPREITAEEIMLKASPREIEFYYYGLQRETIRYYSEGVEYVSVLPED